MCNRNTYCTRPSSHAAPDRHHTPHQTVISRRTRLSSHAERDSHLMPQQTVISHCTRQSYHAAPDSHISPHQTVTSRRTRQSHLAAPDSHLTLYRSSHAEPDRYLTPRHTFISRVPDSHLTPHQTVISRRTRPSSHPVLHTCLATPKAIYPPPNHIHPQRTEYIISSFRWSVFNSYKVQSMQKCPSLFEVHYSGREQTTHTTK